MTDPSDTGVTQGGVPTQTESVPEERVVERRGRYPAFGPGQLIGGLGAIGVVASLFMAWSPLGVHPGRIPVAFLGDDATTSTNPSLLIVLIPLAVILLAGAALPMGTALRLVAGIGALVVVGLFAFQLNESLDGEGLSGALGTGWYFGTVGAFLVFASGLVPEVWLGRREVVRTETR